MDLYSMTVINFTPKVVNGFGWVWASVLGWLTFDSKSALDLLQDAGSGTAVCVCWSENAWSLNVWGYVTVTSWIYTVKISHIAPCSVKGEILRGTDLNPGSCSRTGRSIGNNEEARRSGIDVQYSAEWQRHTGGQYEMETMGYRSHPTAQVQQQISL